MRISPIEKVTARNLWSQFYGHIYRDGPLKHFEYVEVSQAFYAGLVTTLSVLECAPVTADELAEFSKRISLEIEEICKERVKQLAEIGARNGQE